MSQNNKDFTQPPESFRKLFNELNNIDVAGELSLLRDEIKALRDALHPPKSALIVGADVERILRTLK